jgi:hypothetical protein
VVQGRQCWWWWKRGDGGDCMRKIAWLPQTSGPPTAKSKRGGQQDAGGWGWIEFCGETAIAGCSSLVAGRWCRQVRRLHDRCGPLPVPQLSPLTAELRSEGMLPGGPPMDPASGGICIWLACVARGAGVAATTKPGRGQIQTQGQGMLVAT